jgi:hypothetical protein
LLRKTIDDRNQNSCRLSWNAPPAPANERKTQPSFIGKHNLADTGHDWAAQSSTIARDVFYYRKVDLGKKLTLKGFDRVGEHVILHTFINE